MISIIDDDEPVRDSLGLLLDAAGIEWGGFASCEAFLAAGGNHAKCLILDIHMPGMSGLELLDALRRLGDDRPVIVVTAHPTPAAIERARAAGALAILEKPFKASELLSLIRSGLAARGSGS